VNWKNQRASYVSRLPSERRVSAHDEYAAVELDAAQRRSQASEKCSWIGPAGTFSGVGMWEVPYEF
jgi:hypothetical protein